MREILIDSDVILDVFFNREEFVKNAASILQLCKLNKISGNITPISIANIYYLLRKTNAHDKIIQKLTELLNIVEVLEINRDVVINALRSDFKDFEDALQNYSAENQNTSLIIITRNTKNYKKSNLAVMTPESFLKTMEI